MNCVHSREVGVEKQNLVVFFNWQCMNPSVIAAALIPLWFPFIDSCQLLLGKSYHLCPLRNNFGRVSSGPTAGDGL